MKLLIISPYFPPFNAADMQRVRMSLPYYKQFGWDAEVVTVDGRYLDISSDPLLLESLPADLKVHKVMALSKKWTSKLGLGSIALRALWYYKTEVNKLLSSSKYDLIYLSTTQFPVCVLGAYWKKKFGVPYVIDMQDPWHSDYYINKPKRQRPPKFWFSYRLNKYFEPMAMKHVDGLISVSQSYIALLKGRYPVIKSVPSAVITFGYLERDMEIARQHQSEFENLLSADCKNLVYIGRGGMDMHAALTPVFKALKQFLVVNPDKKDQVKLYFIGTSYAPSGMGIPSIKPLAERLGVSDNVFEFTDRISYYQTLATLQQADALFMPGSDDPKYTASKIYPYLLTGKPLLAVFNPHSPALTTLNQCGADNAYAYNHPDLQVKVFEFLSGLITAALPVPAYKTTVLENYSAQNTTKQQCNLFNLAIKGKSR